MLTCCSWSAAVPTNGSNNDDTRVNNTRVNNDNNDNNDDDTPARAGTSNRELRNCFTAGASPLDFAVFGGGLSSIAERQSRRGGAGAI